MTEVAAAAVAMALPIAQPLRVWAGLLGAALAYSVLVGGITLLGLKVVDEVILFCGVGICGATIGYWLAELFPHVQQES